MSKRFITVSIELMHDKNLTANQKFILAEIEQLSELEKGCIAQNKHFSDLTGIAKESVSRCIKDLEIKGYITTEIVNGSRNHVRIITINKMLSPPKQNVKPPLTKHQETKENKTINKTINITLEDVANMWNHFAEFHNKPKVVKLTNKRKEKLRLRINELKDYKSALIKTLDLASKSTFCKEGNWFNFDWLIENDTNLIKVYEGKYDDKEEVYY